MILRDLSVRYGIGYGRVFHPNALLSRNKIPAIVAIHPSKSGSRSPALCDPRPHLFSKVVATAKCPAEPEQSQCTLALAESRSGPELGTWRGFWFGAGK